MIYKTKHKIGVNEVNKKLEITNKSIIELFQNNASFHADSIGLGILDIPKTNLSWLAVDWKIKVIDRPKYGDIIEINSWGRNAYDCFAYQDFKILINNKLAVIATSKWMLFNIKTHNSEVINDKIKKDFNLEDNLKVFEETNLEHMRCLDEYSDKWEIIIRKSDLDFNNHVNNVKYFDYITDFLPDNKLNNIRITYRKEIKVDEKIYLFHKLIKNTHFLAIKDNKGNVKALIESIDEK